MNTKEVNKKAVNKKVLMIAYHFPPCRGSSGIQRTLKFSRYLPDLGWQPIILAPNKMAFPQVGDDLLKEIHPDAVVYRTWALDIARHLSFRGVYIQSLGIPDRWNSWVLSAVPAGLRIIKKHKPDLIWSTYPVATAQLIGLILHKITKIPWIADFRDPMLYETWPSNPLLRRVHGWLEQKVVRNSRKVVVTTPSTKEFYIQRYKDIDSQRWEVINNGYDEDNFVRFQNTTNHKQGNASNLVLVHSGLMEPEDRNPEAFFRALEHLGRSGVTGKYNLKVILRASGHDASYQKLIEQHNLTQTVFLEPQIGYGEALEEMYCADALLIFQGSTCNRQIPAKAYEYLRAQKPIFALADPEGDTAKMLRSCDVNTIVPLDDEEAILHELPRFLERLVSGQAVVADLTKVRKFSREALTGDLVNVFNTVDGS